MNINESPSIKSTSTLSSESFLDILSSEIIYEVFTHLNAADLIKLKEVNIDLYDRISVYSHLFLDALGKVTAPLEFKNGKEASHLLLEDQFIASFAKGNLHYFDLRSKKAYTFSSNMLNRQTEIQTVNDQLYLINSDGAFIYRPESNSLKVISKDVYGMDELPIITQENNKHLLWRGKKGVNLYDPSGTDKLTFIKISATQSCNNLAYLGNRIVIGYIPTPDRFDVFDLNGNLLFTKPTSIHQITGDESNLAILDDRNGVSLFDSLFDSIQISAKKLGWINPSNSLNFLKFFMLHDHKLYTLADNTFKTFNMEGKELFALVKNNLVTAAVIGDALAMATNKEIELWNLKNEKLLAVFPFENIRHLKLHKHPTGLIEMAAIDEGGLIKFWTPGLEVHEQEPEKKTGISTPCVSNIFKATYKTVKGWFPSKK